MIWTHPSFWLLLGSLLVLAKGSTLLSKCISPVSYVLAMFAVSQIESTTSWTVATPFGSELQLISLSEYSLLFTWIFLLIGFAASIYGFWIQNWKERVVALFYAAGATGMALAGDWISFLGFWEVMGIGSFLLVFFSPVKGARRASLRYLLIHAFADGFLFMGTFRLVSAEANLELHTLLPLQTSDPLAFYGILIGLLINAAAVPVHNWLTDAYPKGSMTGSVYLSALTTKSAVYSLLILYPGTDLLITLGAIMALYGVFYAMMQNHLRKLLAYHIVSQVGFMVAGVGIGTKLALNGAAAHAFCHILYKGLLFMAAGAFFQKYHASKLSEFSKQAKESLLIWFFYMIGAVSIAGIPGFNGFISKPMILEAAHLGGAPSWVYYVLKLASIGTFLSVAVKVPFIARSAKVSSSVPPMYLGTPKSMIAGMSIPALLCILLGLFPSLLYRYLPFAVDFTPYSFEHLSHDLQVFLGAGLGFWLLRSYMKTKDQELLDWEYFYRKPLRTLLEKTVQLSKIGGEFSEWFSREILRSLKKLGDNPMGLIPSRLPHGQEDSRLPYPIGHTILWVLGAFCVALFFLGHFS